MSTGSSGSISVSRWLPLGGGAWANPAEPLPAAPPPSAHLHASNAPTAPARPVPLRPIPIPIPAGDGQPATPSLVAIPVPEKLDDVTLGRMFADALKRREFVVTVVSSAVHMVLIILLALFHLTPPTKNVVTLEASVDVEAIRPDLQPTPQLEAPVHSTGSLIRGVTPPTAQVKAPLNVGRNPLATKTLSSFNALMFSDATKSGGANGLDSVSFFNSTAVATRIVFIVDASTSMDGPKFERAKEELLTAVSNLNPRQRFYVFFFSDKEYPMLPPRSPTDMLALDTKTWDAVLRWVNEQGLVGDTRPKGALRRALAMKPDVVYLLTDGDFNDDAYSYLMGVSNYKVRINTIGFQTGPKARDVLEKIARKFRGEFTEVD